MTKVSKSEAAILRQKAVELLDRNKSKSGLKSPMNEAEIQKLIHELEVYQIELEMQNDELVLAKEQAELYFQKYIVIKECVPTIESLVASEARYRRLFESSKDGILILDAETGIILDVNPFLIEMLGYSEDQFRDKAIWEIGFFKDIFANHENFLELQQKEYVRYDDLPLETADGSKINVEFVSNIYLLENREFIQCNIRETTIRKQSELALRESESRLRTLVQTIPDLIWLKDTKGVYLSCNPMFERFFGAREADIIGKTDYDFVDRELADFFRKNDRKAMEAGKPTSNEEWVTFADGGHRAFLDTIKTPIYDSAGTVLGILGIGRDITERKLAGQVLKASEKRFRAIFDQAPIAIALIDLQGHPIISNVSLSKMLGYTMDELSKMMFTDFTYPEDIDKDMNQFTDLLAGKISEYKMEKRYIHKNGDLIWANLTVTTLSDNNGMPGEIIGMVEDITERKSSEKEIAMLAHSLKSINECVSITDQDDKILFVNESFLKTYGYNLNELIGENISIVRSQANEQKTVNEILPATILGEWQGELLNRRKDGSEFPIYLSTTIIKDKDGNPLGLIGVAKDITERRKSEHEIKFQADLLNNVGQAVIASDLHDRVIYWNNSAQRIFGWSSDEAMGQNIVSLIPSNPTKKQARELFENLSHGMAWSGEYQMERKDGNSFQAYVTDTPILDISGELIGVIGISSDITERKLAETELIIAKEKAQEGDRLKSAFLANMSHEVRTPLNSIIGFSELLTDPDFDKDDKDQFIQHIISSGNNLLTIISDIMDISKIESGEIKIRKSQINAKKFISTIKEGFAYQTEEKKLNLGLNYPDNDEETIIIADVERLRQIFNNLMSNAIKFTETGQIEIGYQPKGKMVEFFVKDTGIGIPASYHDKIFDRFRQVEDEKTRKYGGNGLGLTITKNLVGIMGGKIRLESE